MFEDHRILECDFAFKCPWKWEALAELDNPDIRYCNSCEREVFYAYTRNEFDHHKALGRCVAANVYEPEVFGYRGMMGEPSAPGMQSKDKTEPFMLRSKKLLILGTDENKNEVESALRKMKRKRQLKQNQAEDSGK